MLYTHPHTMPTGSTSHVMMVRPAHFKRNPQTAESNAFQSPEMEESENYVQEQALYEFDNFVLMLRQHGVTVNVIQDTPEPVKPDAIFPNNWVSFHENGRVITYPLEAPNRRLERRSGIFELLERGYQIRDRIDLTYWEEEGIFLESTGSLIFDRIHKIAYACLSSRTQQEVFADFEAQTMFRVVPFHGTDTDGLPIYHTNVMMCIAQDFVVICMEAVRDPKEREMLETLFAKTGKEVVTITTAQMLSFAGNMLELVNDKQERLLVMSEQAYHALYPEQIAFIQSRCIIVNPPLYTIEKYGGGSARCMIAEVFLPLREEAPV